MNKVFEDEFMDIQSGIIALCMEALDIANQHVDKVFAYCCNEEHLDGNEGHLQV